MHSSLVSLNLLNVVDKVQIIPYNKLLCREKLYVAMGWLT